MSQDLDILTTDGTNTQFTQDAVQRFFRQKMDVALEWKDDGTLTVLLHENGALVNAGDFVNFDVNLATSDVRVIEEGAVTFSDTLDNATNPSSGRYEFTVTPSGGVPRVEVLMETSFAMPAVGATPATTVTQDTPFNFLVGRLDMGKELDPLVDDQTIEVVGEKLQIRDPVIRDLDIDAAVDIQDLLQARGDINVLGDIHMTSVGGLIVWDNADPSNEIDLKGGQLKNVRKIVTFNDVFELFLDTDSSNPSEAFVIYKDGTTPGTSVEMFRIDTDGNITMPTLAEIDGVDIDEHEHIGIDGSKAITRTPP